MKNTNTVCHSDGTVSYWSVYQQSYREHVRNVPDEELAAMPEDERRRVVRCLDTAAPEED
jgi:hypothetical protein